MNELIRDCLIAMLIAETLRWGYELADVDAGR
jgi:hypothetical protein